MKNTNNFLTILALIFIGVASRLIPHAVNVTAVGATALFAGACLRPRWMAFAIPMSILFLTDLYLGFYSSMWGVYAGFSAGVIIGTFLPALGFSGSQIFKIGAGALGTGLMFFGISNFAVWLNDLMYPLTVEGLLQCYTAALPFLRQQLTADFLFSVGIFGIYAWVARSQPAETKTSSQI